jgi:adenine-specific DNA methylase
MKQKLIEVALPLDAINKATARGKSRRIHRRTDRC